MTKKQKMKYKEAEKLGFKIVDYILKPEHKADKNYRTYPDGPVDSVSFFPAGIGTGGTPNNQTNLTGLKGYNRWKKHMKKLAQLVGYKLFNFIKDFKDEKRSIQIGSRETLKQQKEEELDEQTLTKEWWKTLLTDVINPDTPVRYKDDKGNQKTVKFSSAIRYDTRTDANYREEAGEVLLNLPDQPLFKDKDTEEVVDFLKNNSEDRQLTTDEIKYMSNTEAGQTLKIMNDDSGDEDEFGDTDKTKRVKNLINYQNFEDPNRWNYTDKALAMFKEKGIRPPKYDDSGGDDAYDDPKNHKQFKKFKEYMNNPEIVEKKAGGEAGGKWRNVDGLIDAFKDGAEIPSNLVAQDKDGNTHLVGGNTRFVAALAAGVNPITKVIQVDKVDKIHDDHKKWLDEQILTKEWWKKLLLEGGAYGHMAHPFDDKNLTFKDLKEIITMGLGGQLNREDNVTEKLDGQNLMISWKDGKLIAARNKGHLKNAGETALDAKGIASKFAGRGSVSDAFSFAMKDLQKAIGSLSQKQKDKIFMNGKAFMNLEVMWPKNPNVIDYDKAEIIFHGALEYNDAGSPIGEVKGSGRILQGMIQQINQHIQKHYKIGKPIILQIPKHQDFGKKKKAYISRLNKLQKQYRLKDNDTLALYHQSFWEEFIYNAAKQIKYKIPNNVLIGLTKRWAFFDKSYKIPQMKKDIKNDKFLDWVISFDKNDHSKWVKDNMIPFEKIFFEVGAEILKNVKGFMAANPDKAVQSMRKQLDKSISDIKSGGDINKIKKVKSQLDKINSMGGLNAIVPSEGIVFKYNGNIYKFTGAFAPVNQITGLAKFG